MKRVILSRFNGFGIKKVIAEFMKRTDSLSAQYSHQMKAEVLKINNELQLPTHHLLNILFNSYRKIYNIHTLFKKSK